MTTDMILHFLVFVFISTGTPGSEVAANTEGNRLEWYQAYLTCHRHHQALPFSLSASTLPDLLSWLPENGARVWLGGRYGHTPWRWSDGCGVSVMEGCVETRRLPHPRVLLSTENPLDCLLKCDSPFVAIQGRECQCLWTEPGHKVKVEWCDLGCADDLDQSCGGLPRYASLYSKQPSSVRWDRGEEGEGEVMEGECGYLHLPTQPSASLADLRIRTAACDGRITRGYKRRLCQRCSEITHQCHVTRHKIYVTWLDAEYACQNEGGELLNVRTNQSLPLLFHPYISEDYWIGLKREFVFKWIDGSTVADSSLSTSIVKEGGFCLAASRGNNREVRLTTVDCSLQLPFFCVPGSGKRSVTPSELDYSEFCRSSQFSPLAVMSPTLSTQNRSSMRSSQSALSSKPFTSWSIKTSSSLPSQTKQKTTSGVVNVNTTLLLSRPTSHQKTTMRMRITDRTEEHADSTTSKTSSSVSESPMSVKTSRTSFSNIVKSRTSASFISTSTASSYKFTFPRAKTSSKSTVIHSTTAVSGGDVTVGITKKKNKLQLPGSGGPPKVMMTASTFDSSPGVTKQTPAIPRQSSTPVANTRWPKATAVSSSSSLKSGSGFVGASTSLEHSTGRRSTSDHERLSSLFSKPGGTTSTLLSNTNTPLSSTERPQTSMVSPDVVKATSLLPGNRLFSSMQSSVQNGFSTTTENQGQSSTDSGKVAIIQASDAIPSSSFSKHGYQTTTSEMMSQYASTDSEARKSSSPLTSKTNKWRPPNVSGQHETLTSPRVQSTAISSDSFSKFKTSGSKISSSSSRMSTLTPQTRTRESLLTSSVYIAATSRRQHSVHTPFTTSRRPSRSVSLTSIITQLYSRLSTASTWNSRAQETVSILESTSRTSDSPEGITEYATSSSIRTNDIHKTSNTKHPHLLSTTKSQSGKSASTTDSSNVSGSRLTENSYTSPGERTNWTHETDTVDVEHHGIMTQPNGRHRSASTSPTPTPTTTGTLRSGSSEKQHKSDTTAYSYSSSTTMVSTRRQETARVVDEDKQSLTDVSSQTPVGSSPVSAGLHVNADHHTDPQQQSHRTRGVVSSTISTKDHHDVTPYDLMPLYLVMGVLSALLIVVGAVVCGVIRHRIQGTSRWWTRMENHEEGEEADSGSGTVSGSGSVNGRDNFSGYSQATVRSRYSIEADPKFRFVERSDC